jgi:pimeloyl-ACP methyl ester carboxylesterase
MVRNPIRKVKFPGKAGQLVGTLRMPETGNKFPFAILTHGWRSNRTSDRNSIVGAMLASLGIGSIAFDFRGHNDSEGDITQVTVPTEAEDIISAYDYLTTLDEADLSGGVSIAGASIGASAALYAMAARPEIFCGGVLISPRLSFARVGDNMYSFVQDGVTYENKVMLKTGKKIDFYKLAEKVTQHVLVLHGTKDASIPIEQSQKLVEKHPNFHLEEVKGGDHQLKAFTNQVAEATATWLADRLTK